MKKKKPKYKRIKYEDRLKIEVLIKANHGIEEIGVLLGFHRTSIMREIRRGTYTHRNSDWTEEKRYAAELAEQKARENLKAKGPDIKLGKDYRLAKYLEEKIGKEKYSPAAALATIKREKLTFDVSLSRNTIYAYLDRNIFLTITNKDLPVKRGKTKVYKKVRMRKRACKGESIEKRSDEISRRETFGHWEMDTVMGAQGISKKSLLVFTERKTRYEIIEPLMRHTTAEVVRAVNRIERKWGAGFRKVFQTITVDNGTEFADCEGLEKSRRGKRSRTKLYYCHPYTSSERGSNENQNKLIRRHIPKGANFDNMTRKELKYIEGWINNYPREIFGFRTARELYEEEIHLLLGNKTKIA